MYIKVLTNDDGDKLSKLLKDGDWMVLYYAEWCGHCNSMKPEWEKVVEKFKDTGKIHIADVKSDVIGSLAHKPKIEGFPTIKMYNKGREVAKFEDERSAHKMEKFAMANSVQVNNNIKKTKPLTLVNMENNNINGGHLGIGTGGDENTIEVSNLNIENNLVKKTKKNIKTRRWSNPNNRSRTSASTGNSKCSNIKKAKFCKTNPNCFYDYSEFKCKSKSKSKSKDKIPSPIVPLISFSSKHSKSHHSKSRNQKSKKQDAETKEMLQALIKSFSKIGNEARKDSILLKKAASKI
jgi:thiol-disulfide isomerase/thioredoxin